ncbi:MAG TPA: flagellar type III secretion system protein FliR, partial [Clostridiales bacterium]|nr:flagellar type III secretion system protein FliR [Clostridiales bacterium]
ALIRILAETFVLMPPGNFEINLDIGVVMVEFFLLTVALTLRLAMPVMAAMFITETALGIVIRTVPQMNMFVVGIPIKIIVGFVVMVLTVPVFFGLSGNMFDLMFTSIRELARRMVL